MAKRVTLGAFVDALRADVAAFEEMWLERREKDPKNWPATQPTPEDWQDQFLAWMETREQKRTPAEPSSP